jgi:large subunit ribosomal protein L15
MNLSEVYDKGGGRPSRKRRGRGPGSGLGKTSGRGHKGAKSRSGWKRRYAYEGGQIALVRRTPKRGFTNAPFRKRYDLVNLRDLEASFDAGSRVDLHALTERKMVNPRHGRLKVLAAGELTKSLTIAAHAISEAARKKVEAAGGSVEILAASPSGTSGEDGSGKAKKKAGK